jgi:hypothetical protein
MWRQKREYLLAELLDHPVLGLVMRGTGMDRQAVELLLEATCRARQPEPDHLDDRVSE